MIGPSLFTAPALSARLSFDSLDRRRGQCIRLKLQGGSLGSIVVSRWPSVTRLWEIHKTFRRGDPGEPWTMEFLSV